MEGRRIGRYRLVVPLGEGGMGTVWKAEDVFLGRGVALKLMPPGLAESQQARQRFMREARSASALDHPSIATLYEAGEDDGRLYLAFALVDGETLRDRLRAGPLAISEVIRIGADAASALAHAHERGVIHRDVSAGNIMVARDGRVVVIDFGLAVAADAAGITTSGTLVGTIAYIAPEVAFGHRADHRSDIYSLGVLLYELVTGALPFRGASPPAVLYGLAHGTPVPPRSLRADLDSDLEQVILRAMARDPECRFARIEDLAAELRGLDGTSGTRSPVAQVSGALAPAMRRTAIAVVPFAASSAESAVRDADDVLCRGLSETLSAALARHRQLQIVPPGQSGPAGPNTNLRDFARHLGVHLLLIGNVRRVGEQLRISYSLVDGWEGEQLAGDMLTGSVLDLFALEDALVASVIRSLRIESADAIVRMPGMSGSASHELYLTALGYLQRSDSEASIDAGIRVLEELLASEGPTTLVHAALGRACLRKFELTADPLWRGRAEQSCRLALNLDPHSTDVLVTLGRLLQRTGRSAEAATTLHQAIALNASDAEAWIALSWACEGEGDLEGARSAASTAVELRPSSWLSHDRLALVQYRMGRFEDAAREWMRAVEITPDNSMVLSNLAATQFHMGRCDEAVVSYLRAIAISPTASAHFGLGTLYFYTGRRKEAIEMFERAAALRPRDARAWGNLADAQRWVEGLEAASAASFDRAIALAREHLGGDPHDAEMWSRMGKWLAKRMQIDAALEATRRAIELSRGIIAVRARAITVFELAGRRAEAVEHLAAALHAGYSRMELENDPELGQLREDPRVRELFETV